MHCWDSQNIEMIGLRSVTPREQSGRWFSALLKEHLTIWPDSECDLNQQLHM